MKKLSIVLLMGTALAACSSNTSVPTTPTFSAARFVPQVAAQTRSRASTMQPVRSGGGQRGVKAVEMANLNAVIEPDSGSMRGGTWFIDAADQTRIYRVFTKPNHVTTVLLPPGERFNGAVGGDVESFLINVAYAGPRPAVSILPRSASARGNLQLVTTGGFYSFDLKVMKLTALNLVDVDRQQEASTSTSAMPQPEGDFTRLSLVPVDDKVPAWAPVEAWADSYKLVVRFNDPLPQLPSLFAGQQGEQMVNYRSLRDAGSIYLVTDRRVTEAELRLDKEKLRLTVDPAAVASGSTASAGESWQGAAALPAEAGGNNVAVLVMPGAAGSQAAVSNVPGGSAPGTAKVVVRRAGWL